MEFSCQLKTTLSFRGRSYLRINYKLFLCLQNHRSVESKNSVARLNISLFVLVHITYHYPFRTDVFPYQCETVVRICGDALAHVPPLALQTSCTPSTA